ncbi:hypothetical protein ABK040_010715 [Willaertia magna]
MKQFKSSLKLLSSSLKQQNKARAAITTVKQLPSSFSKCSYHSNLVTSFHKQQNYLFNNTFNNSTTKEYHHHEQSSIIPYIERTELKEEFISTYLSILNEENENNNNLNYKKPSLLVTGSKNSGKTTFVNDNIENLKKNYLFDKFGGEEETKHSIYGTLDFLEAYKEVLEILIENHSEFSDKDFYSNTSKFVQKINQTPNVVFTFIIDDIDYIFETFTSYGKEMNYFLIYPFLELIKNRIENRMYIYISNENRNIEKFLKNDQNKIININNLTDVEILNLIKNFEKINILNNDLNILKIKELTNGYIGDIINLLNNKNGNELDISKFINDQRILYFKNLIKILFTERLKELRSNYNNNIPYSTNEPFTYFGIEFLSKEEMVYLIDSDILTFLNNSLDWYINSNSNKYKYTSLEEVLIESELITKEIVKKESKNPDQLDQEVMKEESAPQSENDNSQQKQKDEEEVIYHFKNEIAKQVFKEFLSTFLFTIKFQMHSQRTDHLFYITKKNVSLQKKKQHLLYEIITRLIECENSIFKNDKISYLIEKKRNELVEKREKKKQQEKKMVKPKFGKLTNRIDYEGIPSNLIDIPSPKLTNNDSTTDIITDINELLDKEPEISVKGMGITFNQPNPLISLIGRNLNNLNEEFNISLVSNYSKNSRLNVNIKMMENEDDIFNYLNNFTKFENKEENKMEVFYTKLKKYNEKDFNNNFDLIVITKNNLNEITINSIKLVEGNGFGKKYIPFSNLENLQNYINKINSLQNNLNINHQILLLTNEKSHKDIINYKLLLPKEVENIINSPSKETNNSTNNNIYISYLEDYLGEDSNRMANYIHYLKKLEEELERDENDELNFGKEETLDTLMKQMSGKKMAWYDNIDL